MALAEDLSLKFISQNNHEIYIPKNSTLKRLKLFAKTLADLKRQHFIITYLSLQTCVLARKGSFYFKWKQAQVKLSMEQTSGSLL